MNIAPSTDFEAVLDAGSTGLAGTLRLKTIDNDGAVTQAASSADITEVAWGVYSAERTSPDTRGQYTLVWDGGTDADVLGIEDLVVTFSAAVTIGTGDAYATVDELFRILKIRNPSAEQEAAGDRVLIAAAVEINAEIDLVTAGTLSTEQLALVAQVNLQRAAELWFLQEVPLGVSGIGSEFGTTHLARNSWDKYAYTLAPLKEQWGLA